MKLSAEIRIDADALVALVAEIARRAGRAGPERDGLLDGCRALAERPDDFFNLTVDGSGGAVTVRAVPNLRLVALMELLGGVE